MRQRPTWLYYCSWALIAIILLTAIFGGMIKPHGIQEENKITFLKQQMNNETKYLSPPLAPSSSFLLGTDHRGYDLVSLMLNGLKYTLGIVLALTLLRMVLGTAWGLWVGVTGRFAFLLRAMHKVTSTVPPFLFIYPPVSGVYVGMGLHMGIKANPQSLMLFTVIFVAMVTFFGVIPLAYQVAERTRYYNDMQYVEASRLMGGSILHRTIKHILPNMRLELLFTTLSEFVQVIFLIGQLAVFHIIVWGSERIELDDVGVEVLNMTSEGEWLSILTYGMTYVRSYPWIVLSAAAALSLLVLSVHLFLNQLKKRYSGTAGF
jgi:peptide/nickel transport system permease protein